MTAQSATTPCVCPNSSSSRMMLERQSTTVPKTSNANTFGLIVVGFSRKRSSRLQHDLPQHTAVCQGLQRRSALRKWVPHRRWRPETGLHQFAHPEFEHRLRSGSAVDVLAVAHADDADVAQEQPVDLDRRNTARRKA